jgi:hypothetical protein
VILNGLLLLTRSIVTDIIYKPKGAWCSGLTCRPVKPEIAGSNPVAPEEGARENLAPFFIPISSKSYPQKNF